MSYDSSQQQGRSSQSLGSGGLLKALEFLRALASDDEKVSEFLERSFRGVTRDVIEHWVKNKVELLPPSVKKIYFENPVLSPWTRRVLKRHWTVVEHYLGRPENTFEKLISVNPGNSVALSEEEATRYVKKQLDDAYLYFKKFAWSTDQEVSSLQ